MGTILDVEYTDKRWNDDLGEWEYYIPDCNDYMTEEEIQEWLAESEYWVNWANDIESREDKWD